MKKLILALILVLGGAVNAFGQSTTVSGQVTDAGGQSWNNGTFTATFVPNPQFPTGPYTWTGGTLNNVITGTLNGTGAYSVSIPSNTAISPQGSQWQFQFVPNATSSPFLTSKTTITGATQTLNATPPAISINLQNPPGPFTTAYADAEIATPIPQGAEYFNTTSLLTRVWNGSAWSNQGSGGGGGATPCGGALANQVTFFTAPTTICGNAALTFNPAAGGTFSFNGANAALVGSTLAGISSAGVAAVTATPSGVTITGTGTPFHLTSTNAILSGGNFQLGSSSQSGAVLLVGSTSGTGSIGANPVAGTPNLIYLPTATGTAGQCLQTDGANPQQSSWVSCGTGTVTGSGVANQLAFWTGASAVGGNAALTFNPGTTTLTFNGTLSSLTGSTGSLIKSGSNVITVGPASISVSAVGNPIGISTQNLGLVSGGGALSLGFAGAGSSGGVNLFGLTSGSASLGVAAVAGTPNPINLPTTTGTAGGLWTTDGGNPQITSWTSSLLYAAPTLTVSGAGAGNGVLALSGNTSGTATFTAPAVAGTATNPVTASNGLALPNGSTSAPSYGFTASTTSGMHWDGTNNVLLFANQGTDIFGILSGITGSFGSTGTLGWTSGAIITASLDTGISRLSADVLGIGNGTQGDVSGTLQAAKYKTATNCANGASPAVCGSASSGSVAVPAGTNPTLTVNTTAVTASSVIVLFEDESLGAKLSVTCQTAVLPSAQFITARVAATSFTIQANGVFATNPVCYNYLILN